MVYFSALLDPFKCLQSKSRGITSVLFDIFSRKEDLISKFGPHMHVELHCTN